MPNAHPRPWRRDSVFGDGLRIPMCRERRAQWKARLAMHERAGRITSDHEKIGLALLKRLGQDGRCDPSYQTLATDSGKAASTVQRALRRLADCGLLGWLRRIVREGSRVVQTSNSYMLTLGNPPTFPEYRCKTRTARQTLQIDIPYVPITSPAEIATAQQALAMRRAAFQAQASRERHTHSRAVKG
jgi:hypothetical protein